MYKAYGGSNYLYKSTSGSWHVYNSQDNSYAYIYCPGNRDVLECGNQWMYYSNYWKQWLRDDHAVTWDCGAGAVNVEFDCDEQLKYTDTLCINEFAHVRHNLTAWRVGELCENSMPSFSYNNPLDNNTYYLSYQEYKEYVDDTEVSSKWVISKNQIGSAQEIAYCNEAELLDCVEGRWYAQEIGEGTELTEVDGNVLNEAYVQFVNASTMSIGYCDMEVDLANDTGLIIGIVVLLLIVAVVMIIFGFYLYRRCERQNAMKQKEKVEDNEQDVNENESYEADDDTEKIEMTNSPTQP